MFRALCLLICLSVTASLFAGVGDPTIRTDHPVYPGEGAFQTIEQCVEFATQHAKTSQEKAIALYLWLLQHQYHLMSPQEWCVPGRVPDNSDSGDYELVPFDANKSRFSYGYGLCGTVHAWNEPYWNALDMRPRRRAFPGHVNSEVFYDDSWHAFDTDMAGILFRRDGVVAGYDDIANDPTLVDSVKPPLPHYPFAWPGDRDVMAKGWREIANSPDKWYKMYNSGYAAQPGIVNLRAGESFTRWFDPDHFGGPTKRRFWHNKAGGPRRNWSFLNTDEPFHRGDQSNSRNDASYCNGEFIYEPSLETARWREGTARISGNVAIQSKKPKLFSKDGERAEVVFEHFSPYVICGDPADDTNPMSGRATGGVVVEGIAEGEVNIATSMNGGLTWSEVAVKSGESKEFSLDLTDTFKGRYGWQIKFSFSDAAGLDQLRFTTVTQVAQAIYPRLTSNGSTVSFNSGSRGVVTVLPDFGQPEEVIGKREVRELRSGNVIYTPRGEKSRTAYTTTNNKPGSVVFRLDSPADLREIRAAMRYQIRVPPPEETGYRLDYSLDYGSSWQELAVADIPADNEFSSGWLAGSAQIEKANVRDVLVRATVYAGGHRTGLIDLELYGVYETTPPQELQVEYGWRDAKHNSQTYSIDIPAGEEEKQFTVPTGENIKDEFVRLSILAE